MPRPVRMSPLPSGFGEGRAIPPILFRGGLENRNRPRAPEPAVIVRAGLEHLHAEFQRIGLRRRRRFVDERLGGERRLRTVRIAQIAGAKRRLPHRPAGRRLRQPSGDWESRTCPKASRRCRRPALPASIPSVVRSARYPARCSRGGCSRTSARCSRRRPDGPAHPERRAPSPGMPDSWYPTPSPHPASTACERAGRSRCAIQAASQPASSAAVRPKPCGPCIQTTRTLSCGMPRNAATPLPHAVGLHVVRIDGHLTVRRVGRGMGAGERGMPLERHLVLGFDHLCRARKCRIGISRHDRACDADVGVAARM